MQPKMIKTRSDYDAATTEIERLLNAVPGTSDGDRLELLMHLVEVYEAAHSRPLDCDPVDLLKAHMEAKGLRQRDLAEVLGSASRASEVMRKHRALTKEQIYRLTQCWKLPADLLVRPYELEPA